MLYNMSIEENLWGGSVIKRPKIKYAHTHLQANTIHNCIVNYVMQIL